MDSKDVVIKINVSEIQNLLSIKMDNDKEKALDYIRESIIKKIKRALEAQ